MRPPTVSIRNNADEVEVLQWKLEKGGGEVHAGTICHQHFLSESFLDDFFGVGLSVISVVQFMRHVCTSNS